MAPFSLPAVLLVQGRTERIEKDACGGRLGAGGPLSGTPLHRRADLGQVARRVAHAPLLSTFFQRDEHRPERHREPWSSQMRAATSSMPFSS